MTEPEPVWKPRTVLRNRMTGDLYVSSESGIWVSSKASMGGVSDLFISGAWRRGDLEVVVEP